MTHSALSIRAFIGAANFRESREFYNELGFKEICISHNLSYFSITPGTGFYLQDAYVKDWIENTMLFLEVDDLERYQLELKAKELTNKYPQVKLSSIQKQDWGEEFFLHDPAGVLWHIGRFYK